MIYLSSIVVEVPLNVKINSADWKVEMELKLADMIRKAFQEYLLINTVTSSSTSNNRGRRKRLATSGDVRVDVSITNLKRCSCFRNLFLRLNLINMLLSKVRKFCW